MKYDLDVMCAIANNSGHGFLNFDDVRFPIKIEKASSEPDSLTTFEGFILGEAEKAVNTVEMTSNGFKFRAYNDRGLEIERVIFNDPATIVIWKDGTKTVVKCQEGDVYDVEKGLALCISKKALGNKGNFNEVFKKWVPEKTKPFEYKPYASMTLERPKNINLIEELAKVNADIEKNEKELAEIEKEKVEEMRRELVRFCDDKEHCFGCPLEIGCYCTFTEKQGSPVMTDDEIKEAYKLVFENKEEK